MAGIDVLESFGIGTAELDAYERADPPAPGARLARAPRQGPRGKILPFPSPGWDLRLLHRRPWEFGRLSNSLSEGFNDKAKTPKKACCGLSNFERLRKRTSPHLRQKRPRGLMEILGKCRPQEKSENPNI